MQSDMSTVEAAGSSGGIAVIGMAGRFPGARNVDEFWDNLRDGKESVSFFTDLELREAGVPEALLCDPRYVRASPILEGFDQFDASFFDLSPREARLLDPQHRLFLECAWESLENAGYDPRNIATLVGVFGGAGGLFSSYFFSQMRADPGLIGRTASLEHIANDKDFLTTRVSYQLNLRGPSVDVQSACSTSLVAVHLACQSLSCHECGMALAGGVTVRVPQLAGYLYEEGGILSPDGHCRAFDAAAHGTIFGSGLGIVVLKRLEDALADGDPIRAVIRGSAVNNDGGAKLSYAAASGTGQARVIAAALERAGCDPATVTLIEAHGTATHLGDPVEISALKKAFRGVNPSRGTCAIGSVKTNIGHLEAAAGVAGLIKAVLALEHRQIPPSLHFQKPNPRIDFSDGPFYVNSALRDWLPESAPRRAGVSSLGIGGTNAFVVLEEAPPGRQPMARTDAARPSEILCLSTRCETALNELVRRYVRHFEGASGHSPADVCYTAGVGRTPFAERLAVVADSIAELREKLAAFCAGRPPPGLFRGRATETDSGNAALPARVGEPRGTESTFEEVAESWVRGAAVDWHEFYRRRGRFFRIAIPTYPFQRERYWIDSPASRRQSPRAAPELGTQLALPGRRVPSPLTDVQFECTIGVPAWPLLGDHRVYDKVVVPGAWHLALVIAGARQALSAERLLMRDVVFPRALACDECEVRPVQLVFTPAHGEHTFRIWSRDPSDQWQLHARGKCAAARAEALPSPCEPDRLDEFERRCHETIAGTEFYQRLRDRHVELGVAFQWNVQISSTDNETVSRVVRPVPEAATSTGGFVLHPGLIDACIQVAVARSPPTCLPLSIEVCRVFPSSRPPSSIHARFHQTGRSDPDLMAADVSLFDEAGELVLQMEGLTLKRAPRESLLGSLRQRRGENGTNPRASRAATGTRLSVPEKQPFTLQISSRGDFANLEIRPAERRPPVTGEVEIEVRAAGLNFRDVLNALGAYPGDAGELGLECAGVVASVGTGVADFRPGDEVVAVAWKSFSAFVTTSSLLVVPKPRLLSFEQAATIPVAFLTAHYALNHLARIRAGQRVLIHAAAGGVGLAGVQVASRVGAEIFATAGSEEKRKYLRGLGVPHVLNSRTLDFAAEVRRATGDEGVDVVLNSLAREFIPASLAVLRTGGHFVELGKIGIWDQRRVSEFRPGVAYSPVALDAMFTEQTAFVGSLLREIAQSIDSGNLHPLPLRSFPMTEADGAFRFIAEARHIGKVILRVPDAPTGCSGAGLSPEADCRGVEPARPPSASAVSLPRQCWGKVPIDGIRERLLHRVEVEAREALELGDGPPLDPARPLTELGMDSMMAVQLINALQHSTGCRLPATLAFDRPTIDALTDYLLEEMRQRESPLEDAARGPDTPIDSLSGEPIVPRRRDARAVELSVSSLFESPTVAGPAESVKAARSGPETMATIPLCRVARDGKLPLSFAQERLWFLEQLEPGRAVYNISCAMQLCGPMNVPALEQSLRELVRRHEVLRTTFLSREGEAEQVVAGEVDFRLQRDDLQNIPEHDRESEARRLAAEEAQRPFELPRDPMLRSRLLRLGDQDHWLVLTQHHIASDGWSQGVFWREVAALYEAFSAGLSSPLPELPVQYADYAVWQRGWLQGEVLEQQLAFWNEQLAGAPVILELSTDFPRPAVQSDRGGQQELLLDRPLTQALKECGRREGATLFMTLLAAFQVLLSRYSGEQDIVVGSPMAGRNRIELQGLIGFFVNTLVLRTDASGNPTFRQFLGRVRDTALGAYAHQDLPFERLVAELQPERNRRHDPLFQVMFVLQNTPQEVRELRGLSVRPVKIDTVTAKFDLLLSLTERSGGLEGTIEYRTDLFEAATIARLVRNFQTLLAGIVAVPDQRIGELPLMADAERRLALTDWNQTLREYPRDACVHELFEAQVERTPHAVAVVCGDEQLTYTELNTRANQLAHLLRRLGVRPETLVGLCVDRSSAMMIGLLGILKAGGAYLPLDPAYPRERLAFLLDDSRAPIVLTQRRWLDLLPARCARIVSLDEMHAAVEQESAENPRHDAAGENLAYVIYTSGSTGAPKGVQVPHAAVVNFLHSMSVEPGLGENDVLLAVTTLSFDISVLELFLPLMVGARVVIVSREMATDGARLSAELETSAVTVMQATPATWRLLNESGWKGSPHLKILCGGEALASDLADQLLDRGGSVWNLYGPTETTVWSTAYRIESRGTSIPIGRPIANTEVYVLDGERQAVPIGVRGELYIGGAGLARGYLNRPELTAQKFVPHPFSRDPSARLYRTGDQVRWRTDGHLEHLGRLDHQVKLRGFRIELGEIETALTGSPHVAQSVVLLREDRPGDQRLAAYVVLRQPGTTPDTSEFRRYLQEKLPGHMVPSAFVTLDALPLTPNGKVDRKALPVPAADRSDLDEAYAAPRTPIEELLAGIWNEVLGVERIGIEDNFFDLGGHSLLALQLFARIEQQFHKRLPLALLFQQGTVAGIARHLTGEADQVRDITVVELQSGAAGRRRLIAMPTIGGELMAVHKLLRHLGEATPVYGLQPNLSADSVERFVNFERTASQYLQTLREFQPQGPYALIGYSYGAILAYEVARQIRELGEVVDLVAVLDTGPADFDTAPRNGLRVSGLTERSVRLFRILRNLPRWLLDDARHSPRELYWRTRQLLRRFAPHWLLRLLKRTVLPEQRDAHRPFQFPTQNRELVAAHLRALHNYIPTSYPDVVTLFRARTRPLLSGSPPDLGWNRVARGGVDIWEVPGHHDSILDEPHVRSVAEALRRCLRRIRAE